MGKARVWLPLDIQFHTSSVKSVHIVENEWKLVVHLSSNWVTTVINANAAVTLLEQRPEKNFEKFVGSNPAQSLKFFSCLCSSSVTAAFALMTVIVENRRLTYGADETKNLPWTTTTSPAFYKLGRISLPVF